MGSKHALDLDPCLTVHLLQQLGLEDNMAARRTIGLALVVLGVVALVWGGVFWTNRDKVLDAGPLEITTTKHEGVALPPVLGIISLVGGIVLLAIPSGRRV